MPQRRNVSERVDVYNSKVTATGMAGASVETTQLAELSALVELAGCSIDQPTLLSLAAIQTDLQRADSNAVDRLDTGQITSRQYLEQINANLRSAMDQIRVLLGDQRFLAIFGEAGLHPEAFGDQQRFKEGLSTGRR